MISSTNKKELYPTFNASNPLIIHSFRKNFKKNQSQELLLAQYLLVQKINSVKKMKFIYFSNQYLYITKNNSLSQRINFIKITNVVNASLSGEIAILVEEKQDFIIDSMEHKQKVIQILQKNLKHTFQYINVNNTTLQLYLRKDTSQKTFIKQHGRTTIDMKKLTQSIQQFNKGDIKKYTFYQILGQGQHGKIFYAIHNVTRLAFAIKSYRKQNYIDNPKILKKAIIAIEFQQKVRSASLCRLVETFYTKTRTYIIMEYISNYNLSKMIIKRGVLPQDYLKIILAQVASSLSIIHDAGYVYNNLKPTHIVIDNLGHTKLIDFFEIVRINTKKEIQKKFSSYEYCAPEELTDKPLMPSCDWWQLGILAYWLIFQSTPFVDDNLETMKKNIKDKQPDFEKPTCNNYSQKAIDFAKCLLKKKVPQRLGTKNGFLQIMKHPFLQQLKPSQIINRKIQTNYHIKSYKRQVSKQESFCQQSEQLNNLDEQLERFVYDCRLQQ